MSLSNDRIHLGGRLITSPHAAARGHNEYWRVEISSNRATLDIKACLEHRGYATGGRTSPEWLRESWIRCELGQTSYLRCSNDELRGFIRARGIESAHIINKHKKGKRTELVKLLDHADQHPQFPQFTRLPPEIRNRVYGLYFAEFADKLLYAPLQPPLTLASRLVRSETLQMFYARCQFEVPLVQHREWNHVKGAHQKRLRFPPKALAWFHALSQPSMHALRRLRFYITVERGDRFATDWRGDADFGLAGVGWFELEIVRRGHIVGGRDYVRELFPLGSSYSRWQHVPRVRKAVERVVKRINEREGQLVVTADDLKALRKAMEA